MLLPILDLFEAMPFQDRCRNDGTATAAAECHNRLGLVDFVQTLLQIPEEDVRSTFDP